MKRKSTKVGPKRAAAPKIRKNAASKKSVVVLPEAGSNDLRDRIGAPFEPMDLRELIAQAKTRNPTNVDQAFEEIVVERKASQLAGLLSRLGLSETTRQIQKAFETLATALLGMGQVAWSPPARREPGRTLETYATLYALVEDAKRRGLSERAAVNEIASTDFTAKMVGYRPKQDTRLSARSGIREAFWQAWMKAKRREDEILSFLRSKRPFEDVFGGATGEWETKLVALDIQHALRTSGKKARNKFSRSNLPGRAATAVRESPRWAFAERSRWRRTHVKSHFRFASALCWSALAGASCTTKSPPVGSSRRKLGAARSSLETR